MFQAPTRTPSQRTAATAPPPSRWPRRAARLLRVTAVLTLLDTLVQAALAGLFVTGDVHLLDWHAANAQVLTALILAETVAVCLLWRTAKAPVWPVLAALGLLILVGVQQALGDARMIGGHVPLGMTIFGMSAALAYWAFSHRHAAKDGQ
ncbi:hypothetical protein ABZS86_16675 [Streptomyces sp. NPDC005355]|uniref:hypothetical protein n=1 Tax=Streptomyces sp. NPDC005355 TaxID=3157038 RepID=UPI0033AFBAB1